MSLTGRASGGTGTGPPSDSLPADATDGGMATIYAMESAASSLSIGRGSKTDWVLGRCSRGMIRWSSVTITLSRTVGAMSSGRGTTGSLSVVVSSSGVVTVLMDLASVVLA